MNDWITAWYVSWPLHILCFSILGAIGLTNWRQHQADRKREARTERLRELAAAKKGRP